VLANHARLRMVRLLVKECPQTVSGVAAQLQVPVPVASQYLRALEARGLLAARRAGRQVAYRPGQTALEPARGLVRALPLAFGHGATIESLFRQATAFTHPHQ
jgi:DNA-binding transcriptional ArsR family regulator